MGLIDFFFRRRTVRSLSTDGAVPRPAGEKPRATKKPTPIRAAEKLDFGSIKASQLPAEEKIRELKKLATQLKKRNWIEAADALTFALDLAQKHQIFEGLDTELRRASYLFSGGHKDQAFKIIASLMHGGPMFDKPEPDTSYWYSNQEQCLARRCSFLLKEKSAESLRQYVFDAALRDHYTAMAYLRRLEELESRDAFRSLTFEKSVLDHLKSQLRLSEPRDMKKFGLDGLIPLGLEHLQGDYLAALSSYVKEPRMINFKLIERWLEKNINHK